MAHSEQDLLLARLAVHYKVLTKEQVEGALQAFSGQPAGGDFGTFLGQSGWVDAATLVKLQRARQAYLERQQPAAPPSAAAPPTDKPPPTETQPVDIPEAVVTQPVDVPAEAAPKPNLRQPVFATEDAPTTPAAAAAAQALAPAQPPAPAPLESSPSPAAATLAAPALTEGIEGLLRQALTPGISDLHLHSGMPPIIRLHGDLRPLSDTPLEAPEAEGLILPILSDEQRQRLESEGQVDFAHTLGEEGRFRANVYRQQRGLDAVFRAIPPRPPTLEELSLPERLGELTTYHQGIVLLTGPAGCGKSSTMAALVHLINEARPDHIITVEDPIEFVHPSRRCIVNQRQVGPHTESFARALRAALREDPDIIVIGELRDLETVQLALTAAETGHLVLGTLHTSSTIRTVNRLLGVFPADQQSQIRTMVSESLRAVVSQRLLRRADGSGRVPALEVLINNRAAGNLIRDNKTFQLQSVLQTGTDKGMCLLDASLAELVRSGTVSKEEARLHAEEPKRFN